MRLDGPFENPSQVRSRSHTTPNWCLTKIDINTDSEETAQAICDKLEKWLKAPEDESIDGGDDWLGCLAVNSGVIASYDDIDESPIACRGEVECLTLDSDGVHMLTSTAWEPMLEVIYRALEKNFELDGIDIVYSAEEPGCDLYVTNDEDVAGTYCVDIYSDAGEQVMDAFGVEEDGKCDNYSEEDLIEKLEKAFGIGDDENPTIDELLDIAAERPSIYIHMWEYASLFDMF